MFENDRFIPITSLNDEDKEYLKRVMSYEEIVDMAKKLRLDLDCIFLNPNDIWEKICYIKGFFYLRLDGISKEKVELIVRDNALEKVLQEYDSLLQEKNYVELFAKTDKKIRFDLFVEHYEDIPDDQLFEVFIDMYISDEYGFEEYEFCMERVRRCSPPVDIANFKGSIDEDGYVTIYRGEGTRSTPIERAHSWTLSKEKAKFFANRFGGGGKIYMAKVHHSKIFAFIDEGEEEVLIFSEDLIDVKCIRK